MSEPVKFTMEDALRVRGAAEFAVTMSGGQANSRAIAALRDIADRIERAALQSQESNG